MNLELLTNVQIVTFALAKLGGLVQFVDSEDVAICVNQLAPGRFNWRKYPEYIDLSAVNYALQDAKKQRYGNFVVGNSRKGWMLTPTGATWINALHLEDADVVSMAGVRRNSVTDVQNLEAARLRSTRAFELFSSGTPEEISIHDFFQFVRINEYFQSKARERRIAIIENVITNDSDLAELWVFLKSKFGRGIT